MDFVYRCAKPVETDLKRLAAVSAAKGHAMSHGVEYKVNSYTIKLCWSVTYSKIPIKYLEVL